MERFNELGTGALQKSVKLGDIDNGSVMSGQIAGMVSKRQSCAEIISEIMSEFNNLVKA
jgi:enoyl-[acyl-carrier protein] reductase II